MTYISNSEKNLNLKSINSSMNHLIDELEAMRSNIYDIYEMQQNGYIGYNSFIKMRLNTNMYMALITAKQQNSLFKRVDKNMKQTSALLFCSICKTEMVSEFLQMHIFRERCICEKCAYNVKSYRTRICDNCDYPKIKCHNLNVKDNDCNDNTFPIRMCEICSKYRYKMKVKKS